LFSEKERAGGMEKRAGCTSGIPLDKKNEMP
jgi:hypothetical protein